MDARPREIRRFEAANGAIPFSDWMDTLEEKHSDVFGSILTRLDRVEEGNFGDSGHVGKGVWELRIDLGLGYRVYFGEDGDFVILLLGGSKKTQTADIKQAQEFWSDYNA